MNRLVIHWPMNRPGVGKAAGPLANKPAKFRFVEFPTCKWTLLFPFDAAGERRLVNSDRLPLFNACRIVMMKATASAATMRRGVLAGSRAATRNLAGQRARSGLAQRGFGGYAHTAAPLRSFAAQSRPFSVQSPRRMADVDDSFDPKSIERESDEVDVCIVGGGMVHQHS